MSVKFNPLSGQFNLVDGTGAPIDATYLTLSTNTILTNERVATASLNVTITDAGAGSTATFDLSNTTVTPGTYGALNTLPIFTVDAKGRIISASNSSILFPAYLGYSTINGTSGSISAGSGSDSYTFASSNGVTVVAANGSPDTLTVSTPQDIQTSASPTFVNATLSVRTSGRVAYFTTGGAFTDASNFLYNGTQLQLTATGASGGIQIGGDVQAYRDAADRLLLVDRFNVVPSSYNSTSGSWVGIGSTVTGNPSGSSTGRIWGMQFTATANGANNWTDATSGVTGFEGFARNGGSGTVTALRGGIIYGSNNSTGVCTDIIGVLSWIENNNAAGSIGTATVIRASAYGGTNSNVTAHRGVRAGNPAFTANNQTRLGFMCDAMPDPGAFTGTTCFAFDIQGTSRATRDGIRFAQDSEAVIYSSAADTVSTVGGFVANESGGNFDCRIEGDTDVNLFYTDASTDRVGIGTNAPDALFDVDGISRAQTITVDGDAGGTASCNSLTNGTDTLSESLTSVMQRNGNASSTHQGYIKIYVGTTAYYIPYFD